MKWLGLLLLPAGSIIELGALALFATPGLRALFIFCGLAIQALGLALVVHRMRTRRELGR